MKTSSVLRRALTAAIAGLSLATPSFAQNICGDLLRHGIYEHFAETRQTSSFAETRNELCRAYHEQQSSSSSTSGSIGIKFFSAGVSMSSAQLKSIGDSMCQTGSSDAGDEAFLKQNSSTISNNAVNAWRACVTHQKQGIDTNVIFKDTDQGTAGVAVAFNYSRPGVPSADRIVRIDIENLKCDGGTLSSLVGRGNLPVAEQPPLDSVSRSISCSRDIASTPFVSGTRRVHAEYATLEIHTTVGTLAYQLPSIAPATPNPIPRGSIVAWFAKDNTVPAGWAICDGTNGTPDLRNAFVMGVSSGSQVGATGGANQQEAVVATKVDLATGGTSHNQALKVDIGTGIVNHQTGCAGCNLVNSFIAPNTIKASFDNRPQFVGLIFIMKL